MHNKKVLALLLTALLTLPSLAFAAEEFEGNVAAGATVAVTAPYGGTVKSVDIREGQLIAVGDTVAQLETTQTLAPIDGTVRGIFSAVGATLDKTTVLNIAPLSKYTVTCTIDDAYTTIDTLYVTLGEKVYIRCKKDGTHKAEGIITAVNGSSYTVQTTAGELYMEETVYIYRSEAYTAKTRIGSGTVGRTAEIAITATGGLLSLAVSEGETVERGQLLFETVEGSLDTGVANSAAITATTAGAVASIKVAAGQSVSKGDVLYTVYLPGKYQIAFTIDEDMLSVVNVGDTVDITFHWNEDNGTAVSGTVTGISYVSTSSDTAAASSTSATSAAQYTGYASFTADDDVRLGMSVTVTTLDE